LKPPSKVGKLKPVEYAEERNIIVGRIPQRIKKRRDCGKGSLRKVLYRMSYTRSLGGWLGVRRKIDTNLNTTQTCGTAHFGREGWWSLAVKPEANFLMGRRGFQDASGKPFEGTGHPERIDFKKGTSQRVLRLRFQGGGSSSSGSPPLGVEGQLPPKGGKVRPLPPNFKLPIGERWE